MNNLSNKYKNALRHLRSQVLSNESPHWAFTGSLALWLHAHKYGLKSRHPQDIDVVVNDSQFNSIATLLAATNKPGRIGWSKVGENKNYHKQFTRNGIELDIFKAGSILAPNLNKSIIYNGNYAYVINIPTLLERQEHTRIPPSMNVKRPANFKLLTRLKNFKNTL